MILPPNVARVAQNDVYTWVGNAVYLLNSGVCENVYTSSDGFITHAVVRDASVYTCAYSSKGAVIQVFDMHDRVVMWSYTTDGFFYPSLRVSNDFVYVGEERRVVAFRRHDGKQVWSCDTGSALAPLSLGEDDTLYVVAKDENDYLCAIDGNNGLMKWRTPLTFLPHTGLIGPLVCAQAVIVCSQFGCVAFRLSDGSLMWQYQDALAVAMMGVGDGNVCLGYPVQKNPQAKHVDGRMTVVFDKKQCICMLSEIDGTVRWQSAWDEKEMIRENVLTSPVIVNGVAYIVVSEAKGSFLAAFKADNGSMLWSYRAGETRFSTPWVEGNVIYIGSDDGYVSALDAENGAFLWKTFVTTSYGVGVRSANLKLFREGDAAG
jgi:outer membrane protein assembly factor BamB